MCKSTDYLIEGVHSADDIPDNLSPMSPRALRKSLSPNSSFSSSYTSLCSPSSRSSQSSSAGSLTDRQDIDVGLQRRMMREEKARQREEWVAAHSPQPLPLESRKHAMRSLVIASALYHKERSSARLHNVVRGIIQGSRPAMVRGIPNGVPGLPPVLVHVLFNDIETLMKHKGPEFAMSSLMELPLWELRERTGTGCGRIVRQSPRR